MAALAEHYTGEKLPVEELERILDTLNAEVAPHEIQFLLSEFVAD